MAGQQRLDLYGLCRGRPSTPDRFRYTYSYLSLVVRLPLSPALSGVFSGLKSHTVHPGPRCRKEGAGGGAPPTGPAMECALHAAVGGRSVFHGTLSLQTVLRGMSM